MTKWWQQFAHFLHTANLIPLVILVSSYQYSVALRSHDPMLIAIPMALFVDLLHFRTVQRAVQTKKTMWQVTAVFTTALAFGLQWMFYSQPGEDGTLIWWQAILFASIVPDGLAIMAWHHEQHEEEQVVDWQAAVVEAERQAAAMQTELSAMHAQVQAMGQVGKAWSGMNAEMQTLAFFNADLLSVKEAAAQLAVHETTVRRRAKALNGVKGVS